jgi:protein-tyrosine phosphatase
MFACNHVDLKSTTMTHPLPFGLPDPGAPPPRDPARLWRYFTTQWRRAFGLNVTKLDDMLYVGGEFSAAQWRQLYALGVRAVLSLQAEREDVFDGTPPTHVLRLPVPDFQPPTTEQLREAVAFIRAAHDANLPVLIHCHAGVGRAALTTAAFLMTHGLSAEQAFAHVRRSRPIVAMNARQRAQLLEWERVLKEEGNRKKDEGRKQKKEERK